MSRSPLPMPEPGVVHVHLVRLDRADPEDHESVLSADERQRAACFRHPGQRRIYTQARSAVRRICGAALGVPPAAVRFRYGSHGKPYLDHELQSHVLNCTVSHTDALLAVALTQGIDVGIDVEARHLSDAAHEALEAVILTTSERRKIATLPPELRLNTLLTVWTRKEAYVKAHGCGFSIDPARFEVLRLELDGELPRIAVLRDQRRWFLYDVPGLPASFIGALVCDAKGLDVRLVCSVSSLARPREPPTGGKGSFS